MRRTLLIGTLIAVIGSSWTGGATGGQAPNPPGTSPTTVLAITTPPDASSTLLRQVDAETLAPRADALDLGEYHDAWAFSADRRQLAVGTFARTGVRFIDPDALTIKRDVPLPVAAVALGWSSPGRVAVLLQRDGVALVDANKGTIVRRWPLSYRFPCERRRQAVTTHGVVFVVGTREGAVRLIRVDADGDLRVVSLPRVRTPLSSRTCSSAAFAVDPSGSRAVVAGSRGPIAEVTLASLAVRYRNSPTLRRALGQVTACRPANRICTGRRSAVWSAAHTLAISGVNFSGRRGIRPKATPAGVSVINPTTWSARRLDRSATDVAVMRDGTLLTFGGHRRGVRATSGNGSLRWAALNAERVRSVSVSGDRVYAVNEPGTRTHVLDAATGALLASPTTNIFRLDLLTGRIHSGDATSTG